VIDQVGKALLELIADRDDLIDNPQQRAAKACCSKFGCAGSGFGIEGAGV